MGFDISKIQNATLKALANVVDQQNREDGKIDREEFSIFSKQAQGIVDTDESAKAEMSTIFGTLTADNNSTVNTDDVTFTTQTVSNPITAKVKRADKKEMKAEAKRLAENAQNPSEVMEGLTRFAVTAEDKALLADARIVYTAMMNQTYNTLDDIDKNHKTIKKYLKGLKPDKWNGYTQDILKALEEAKERELNSAKTEELVEKFEGIMSTMHNTQAGQEVIKEHGGDNYDAYLDILKDELKESGEWKTEGTKDAYKEVKKYAKKRAEGVYDDKAIETYLNGTSDEIVDISSNPTKANKRHQEILDNNKHAQERMEELKKMTYKQIEDELGKSLARKLRRYALSHANTDGTFDLSGLRTDATFGVDLYAGSDATVNVHSDYQLNERMSVKDGLGLIVNNDRDMFSIGETKDLIEFLGYQNQKKSHNIIDAAKDSLPFVVSGVIAGCSFWVRQTQDVVISNVSDEFAQQLAQEIGAQITKTGSLNEVVINQKQLTNLPAVGSSVATVVGGILLKALIGEYKDETTCFNVQEASHYKSLAELEKFADGKHPEKKTALMALARYYLANNKDLTEEQALNKFYDALGAAKGISSTMNPDECWMTFVAGLKNKPEKPVQPTTPVTPVKPCEDCDAVVESDAFVLNRQGGMTWQGIVEAYYPCLVEDKGLYGKNGAIRALKKALSYDENGNFNEATYKALLAGTDLPKVMILPKEIEGCTRVDDAQVNLIKIKGKGSARARINKVGNGTYTAEDGCDGTKVSGKTKTEAVENLKKKTGKEYKNIIE